MFSTYEKNTAITAISTDQNGHTLRYVQNIFTLIENMHFAF